MANEWEGQPPVPGESPASAPWGLPTPPPPTAPHPVPDPNDTIRIPLNPPVASPSSDGNGRRRIGLGAIGVVLALGATGGGVAAWMASSSANDPGDSDEVAVSEEDEAGDRATTTLETTASTVADASEATTTPGPSAEEQTTTAPPTAAPPSTAAPQMEPPPTVAPTTTAAPPSTAPTTSVAPAPTPAPTTTVAPPTTAPTPSTTATNYEAILQNLLNVRAAAMERGDYAAAYETETPESAGSRSTWITRKEAEQATEYLHTIRSVVPLSSQRLQASYSFESIQDPREENDFCARTRWVVHRYVALTGGEWRLDGEPPGLSATKQCIQA